MNNLEEICMQLITFAGSAKSSYIEAMTQARYGELDRARDLISKGKDAYSKCHEIHQQMFTENFNLDESMKTILLVHAEDQMMASETICILAEEIIKSYERIINLENKGES
ncbi:PTS lactose/cellobiose transporter subunit IIA [Anaerococcus sp. WCA-380-WT-2B]|uniref:PTS lactose/cellobiose transporter subunit IIA n=1 Tax=Anaerococcus porci TaxID=2652269 RepID=A0A6N7VV94_9FIRM|nr:PTS lactose/cellobiose transporter subunit IIA [Anaerococcus porci]MSS77944.1 PTS lactose/cellobiose transporter subunit IIA [Anaerococcus porci]